MKKIVLIVLAMSTLACTKRLSVYSRYNGSDWLTIESRGDNVDDYYTVKRQAESMCSKEGHKNGIVVVDARPSTTEREERSISYTLQYYCKKEK